MRPTRIPLLTAIAIFTQIAALAQTNVTWHTESIQDLRNGEQTAYSCSFRIYAGSRIEWAQTTTTTFTITSTDGDLPASGGGSVTYHLTKEGKDGILIIERTETEDVYLTLDLTGDNEMAAKYKFKVINQ